MLAFAAVGGGGYYLYSAGGDPEAAKNKMKSTSTPPGSGFHSDSLTILQLMPKRPARSSPAPTTRRSRARSSARKPAPLLTTL